MPTLRELFHTLANKHNMLTVGIGLNEEILKECLDETTSTDLKDKLSNILKDLEKVLQSAQEANRVVTEIKGIVYKIIDPDTERPREEIE